MGHFKYIRDTIETIDNYWLNGLVRLIDCSYIGDEIYEATLYVYDEDEREAYEDGKRMRVIDCLGICNYEHCDHCPFTTNGTEEECALRKMNGYHSRK